MAVVNKDLSKAARLFLAGAWVLFSMGLGHALASIVDIFHPFLFTPVEEGVKQVMLESTMMITDRTSIWMAWLGFNISHGLGIASFTFLLIILVRHDLNYLIYIKHLLPLALFVTGIYFMLCIIFWFFLPAVGCSIVLGCISSSYFIIKKNNVRSMTQI